MDTEVDRLENIFWQKTIYCRNERLFRGIMFIVPTRLLYYIHHYVPTKNDKQSLDGVHLVAISDNQPLNGH